MMFFRYLVELGCIKPLCDLLTVMDSKIVQVALNGLENILRLGEQESKRSGSGINPYCALIEEAYGMSRTPGEIREYRNGHKHFGVSAGPVLLITFSLLLKITLISFQSTPSSALSLSV